MPHGIFIAAPLCMRRYDYKEKPPRADAGGGALLMNRACAYFFSGSAVAAAGFAAGAGADFAPLDSGSSWR